MKNFSDKYLDTVNSEMDMHKDVNDQKKEPEYLMNKELIDEAVEIIRKGHKDIILKTLELTKKRIMYLDLEEGMPICYFEGSSTYDHISEADNTHCYLSGSGDIEDLKVPFFTVEIDFSVYPVTVLNK